MYRPEIFLLASHAGITRRYKLQPSQPATLSSLSTKYFSGYFFRHAPGGRGRGREGGQAGPGTLPGRPLPRRGGASPEMELATLNEKIFNYSLSKSNLPSSTGPFPLSLSPVAPNSALSYPITARFRARGCREVNAKSRNSPSPLTGASCGA